MTTVGHRRYVAVLLPFDKSFKIDEQAYRRYVRYFADDPRFAGEGGLCINPEAGEIFYLSREEKRRVLEIAMEEAHGKLPIIAGTWALTTEETVETAKDCKALGVDGIFVTPPRRGAGRDLLLGCGRLPGNLARPDHRAGSCGRSAHRHASGRRCKTTFYPGLPLAGDAAHLPRGQERRRLEDDLYV